jgi:hypothetical protein
MSVQYVLQLNAGAPGPYGRSARTNGLSFFMLFRSFARRDGS